MQHFPEAGACRVGAAGGASLGTLKFYVLCTRHAWSRFVCPYVSRLRSGRVVRWTFRTDVNGKITGWDPVPQWVHVGDQVWLNLGRRSLGLDARQAALSGASALLREPGLGCEDAVARREGAAESSPAMAAGSEFHGDSVPAVRRGPGFRGGVVPAVRQEAESTDAADLPAPEPALLERYASIPLSRQSPWGRRASAMKSKFAETSHGQRHILRSCELLVVPHP